MSIEVLIELLKGIATFIGLIVGIIAPPLVWLTSRWRKAEKALIHQLKAERDKWENDARVARTEVNDLQKDALLRAERFAETTATYARLLEVLSNSNK